MATQNSTTPESRQDADPRSIIAGIVHFDATTVRRTKMRQTAARRRAVTNSPLAPSTGTDLKPSHTSVGNANLDELSPLQKPGVISLAPLVSVALVPSQYGPTVPAATRKGQSRATDEASGG